MTIKLPLFAQAKILVVGDIMLDRYLYGHVERISPEAPVPVVRIDKLEDRVGGAGNVALNVSALGGNVMLMGLVGVDEAAMSLEKLLKEKQAENFLLPVPCSPTIIKSRVIGQSQQLLRFDLENGFNNWDEESFFAQYEKRLSGVDLVIFSDYGKGTLRNVKRFIALAREMKKIILVDPKSKDFSIYSGATIITPNMPEFNAVAGACEDNSEIEAKALKLLNQFEFQNILITRGAKGMSLISKNGPAIHLSTNAREVYDVTGAGDSVIASLGAALAAKESVANAMKIANVAAGISVKKIGAASVSIFELQQAIQPGKDMQNSILSEEEALQQVAYARSRGEKIVMTNGCFDILHKGHAVYLEKAKELGQRLIVAVNSNDSVRRLKGANRPINDLRTHGDASLIELG
jgi:D-beta-D-heptose 7-phosphate kinase/D-beta-D-heptose 1-phosphate adenosyltransferase